MRNLGLSIVNDDLDDLDSDFESPKVSTAKIRDSQKNLYLCASVGQDCAGRSVQTYTLYGIIQLLVDEAIKQKRDLLGYEEVKSALSEQKKWQATPVSTWQIHIRVVPVKS